MLIYPDEMLAIKAMPEFNHFESDADVKWFMQCMDGEITDAEPGEVLFEEGENCSFVPFILEGETEELKTPYSQWKQIESESGLSHSIMYLVAPQSLKTLTKCRVLKLRVMRLLKPCNRHCEFHEKCIGKL